MTRKYLPSFGDLIDRLSIVLLKSVFISEHRGEYRDEVGVIMHDINSVLDEGHKITAVDIHAIVVLALVNREIWLNESKARQGGSEQDRLLKFTHSINGIRSQAKNILASRAGDRSDFKVDAYAAELPEEFGNWRIFDAK
jgi:hypothetical protein